MTKSSWLSTTGGQFGLPPREQWFEDYVATADTRSPDRMRRDAVSELRHADVSSDRYGNEIRAEVTVTENGTGINLFLDREGVYVWFAPEATIEVPDDIEACLERVGFRWDRRDR